MKAAVFVNLRKIEFQDKPKPVIKPGEVLVKVDYCGICGSDVRGYLKGNVTPIGTVMGHEFTGVVAEVGKEVHMVHPGDRVAVKPSAPCLNCYWCRRGEYSLCPKRPETVMGISPVNDGAFAEYVRVSYPGQMIFKLPPGVANREAALVEPFSIALHAVRLSRYKLGDCAMIIGAGMIGLGVIQFLKLQGMSKIIAIEISEKKGLVARELGADIVLNPISEGEKLRDHILALTGGIGADVVFDCAGVPASFQTSMDCVKGGGQILIIGLHEEKVPLDAFALLLREIDVKGVLASYNEFKDIIDLLDQKKINTDLFISDVISGKDLVEKGFEPLVASRDLIKILVKMGELGS